MDVEEWLGKDNQLGIDIWKNKYQYEDESFDDWLERVSGGNAEIAGLIKDKKFLFGGRILANRGLAQNTKLKTTLSNCFSYDTEIVTKDGIKKIGELEGKTIKVFALGKWREAVVKNFGEQETIKLKLKKGKSKKEISVTKDHVWYVASGKNNPKFIEKSTVDLKAEDELQTDSSRCFKSYKPSPFGVAHGAFYGDGDHVGDNRRMNFCGDKSELIQYFTPDTIGESNGVTTICGIPKIFWDKPSLDETPSYLYGWLAGYFATDGSVDERGACVLNSSKREDLEFVQDVLAVLGIPCEEIRVQNRVSNLTNAASDVYILSLNKFYLNESFFILSKHRERFLVKQPSKKPIWKVEEIDDSNPVKEQVYCVVEEETHSFTLKGGILTHNCYVMQPPEDNIESIFDCAKELARTYSYGGGCGVDLSNLAPRGAKVNNAAKTTSGAVSFMDLYSLVTGLIGQGSRRGALMLSLSCEHPDLEEFIGVKSDLDRVTKANISVRITDKFMVAVKNKTPFTLSFTRKDTGETITKEVDAYKVFQEMCKMNWDYAEPGMLFWDRIENWNLMSCDDNFHYAGTNPCAEEPLVANTSCLLGSLNLSEFVTENNTFDFDEFRKAVNICIRALNDVLDEGMPLHPLQVQRDATKVWRPIGLGIMGLADLLIKLKIRYGSKKAIDICDMIGYAMADEAIKTTAELSTQYGSFPNYNAEAVEMSAFLAKNGLGETRNLVRKYGIHNSQLLTIAPTGSLSSMLGISGGIEPIYANYYERKTESLKGHDEYYKVYTPIVKQYMDEHNLTDDSELPDYFVTAQTLDYKERIDMQAVWQTHIDASISSTVNVPNDFTVEEVEDLYMRAWDKGLKGVTIFRDGCKRTGILSTTTEDDELDEIPQKLERGMIIKADDNCVGKKRTLATGCGALHCEAFFDPDTGDLLETYLSKGSAGGCNNFMIGLSRMISLSARGGIDIYSIADQLESAGTCPSYAVRHATKGDTSKGSSCPVAIGNALIDMYQEYQQEIMDNEDEDVNEEITESIEKNIDSEDDTICPECGEKLRFEGGCRSCPACGWTKCD